LCDIRGNLSVAKELLSYGAKLNPDSDGNTPLHLASFEGHSDLIDLFVLRGASVGSRNDDGYTASHFAADNGHLNVLQVLLKHKASSTRSNLEYYLSAILIA
jgi:ankyrin repeat protein